MIDIDERLSAAKLLVIDDDLTNVQLIKGILRSGNLLNVTDTNDSREALRLFLEIQPDVVLLDLKMPYLDGFAVLEALRAHMPPEAPVPVLMLTADMTAVAKRRTLSMGAQDFLTKPLDTVETLLRIRNALQLHFTHQQLQAHNEQLAVQVRERTSALKQARNELLLRLARTAEYRDDETGQHTQRVGLLAAALAQVLELPSDEIRLIRQAAPLHDIGKIGIPDQILRKPGPLSSDELAMMRRHTLIGSRILEQSQVPVLRLGETIARTHHERWDGAGYPNGLSGTAIPLVGRIVAVADTVDVITHDRPYRARRPMSDALAEVQAHSAAQFDPAVVNALMILDRRGQLPA
ncbi:MAG TPA: HD domain-containing phosphohydrolase [Herpetosiphonaceae bacterium]